MKIQVEFKPQDLWVGAFWKVSPYYKDHTYAGRWVNLWICLVPMVPLHIEWYLR